MRPRTLIVLSVLLLFACYVLFQTVVLPRINTFWAAASATATAGAQPQTTVWISIRYSGDKQSWIESAARMYMDKHPDVWVEQVPQASQESLQRLSELAARGETAFAAAPMLWSPASSMHISQFNVASTQSLQREAAIYCRPLLFTPLVLMIWADRAAVLETYLRDRGGLTLDAVQRILATTDGTWQTVGGDPAWGKIKFGMLDPQQSNAGLLALVLMAGQYYSEPGPVTAEELRSDALAEYLNGFVRTLQPKPLIGSITFLGDMLVQDGPVLYDMVLITEAFAADVQQRLTGSRHPTLRLIYPQPTYVPDSPVCLIDRPSLDPKARTAALDFQSFLLQPEVQTLAGKYGYRPALRNISAFLPDSLLSMPSMRQAGVKEDYGSVLTFPDIEAAIQALVLWRQLDAAR